MSAVACHVTRQAALLALPQRLVNDHQPPAQRVVAEKAVVAMVEEEREVEEERAVEKAVVVRTAVEKAVVMVEEVT